MVWHCVSLLFGVHSTSHQPSYMLFFLTLLHAKTAHLQPKLELIRAILNALASTAADDLEKLPRMLVYSGEFS